MTFEVTGSSSNGASYGGFRIGANVRLGRGRTSRSDVLKGTTTAPGVILANRWCRIWKAQNRAVNFYRDCLWSDHGMLCQSCSQICVALRSDERLPSIAFNMRPRGTGSGKMSSQKLHSGTAKGSIAETMAGQGDFSQSDFSSAVLPPWRSAAAFAFWQVPLGRSTRLASDIWGACTVC